MAGSRIPTESRLPNPAGDQHTGHARLYACFYHPPQADPAGLLQIARDSSPRYEIFPPGDVVVIDVAGLERLIGPAPAIGNELRRAAAVRGVNARVAVAGTQTAAMVLARARAGLTVVPHGTEAAALAPVSIGILGTSPISTLGFAGKVPDPRAAEDRLQIFTRWGLGTLGGLAALPPGDLVARLGRPALVWQAIARGEDVRPLIPTLDEERFEATLELEWPIEGLEPLSFVLTRLLEPLSTRLERRDRGAAVLHVMLGLITREVHPRRLELPAPMRDVRSLRTLALLDLESHPPPAAIDRVTLVIDPTPARVLQHRLFTRAHPTPEQISTLLARLGALMGQDRLGAPATVDTFRPGAFAVVPFKAEHDVPPATSLPSALRDRRCSLPSALRRCRQPVPARVAVAGGRPVRVTTDRRGFAGGAVLQCAGPWKTSGNWWASTHPQRDPIDQRPTTDDYLAHLTCWSRDEWDVSLSDGATYRIFLDHDTDRWFIDGLVD